MYVAFYYLLFSYGLSCTVEYFLTMATFSSYHINGNFLTLKPISVLKNRFSLPSSTLIWFSFGNRLIIVVFPLESMLDFHNSDQLQKDILTSDHIRLGSKQG